ncbi:abortive infection protein, AbiV family [Tenacibaculum sp. MAR_2009_124]|uniref:AbiV family abortive infection protein n=1 Tax=Tenacibaculum sp. MAR_2009_124 TaxID=1250059 RepID=UPI0008981A06|nr:AbiV family abortive infection protein [Tenacibaculum sp. MAR_2009_124]SEC66169.1 abortive infection protein, AbiV family [Tenacibaculum sp. MAR_2009_124]
MLNRIIDAIYFTFENSKSLFEDASILKENKKFGRAYTLFHLSFEESGRFYILYNLFISYLRGKIKAKDLNYGKLKKLGYEDHITKLNESYQGMKDISTILLMVLRDQTENEELKKEIEKDINDLGKLIEQFEIPTSELNELKNVGLYVTFKNNQFRLPDKTITVNQFIQIEKLATLSLSFLEKVMEFAEAHGGLHDYDRQVKIEKTKSN